LQNLLEPATKSIETSEDKPRYDTDSADAMDRTDKELRAKLVIRLIREARESISCVLAGSTAALIHIS